MDSPDPRGGVPIAEAAEQLGVTAELLRKRAQRGTIPAYKADGRWFVFLDPEAPVLDETPGRGQDGQDRTSRPGQAATEATRAPAVPPAAMAQLEAIRDQWLAPLVAQIRELSRDNGRLQAERDALAAEVARDRGLADQLVDLLQEERDALRWERDRLAAQAGAAPSDWRERAEGAAERDTLRTELARMRGDWDASQDAPAATGAPDEPDPGSGPAWRRLVGTDTAPHPHPSAPWWRRWLGRR